MLAALRRLDTSLIYIMSFRQAQVSWSPAVKKTRLEDIFAVRLAIKMA